MIKKSRGFTLIELVTVIILLGILSLYVLPKFTGSSSFEAHAYRVQLISALRLAQQRSMQYTADTFTNSDGADVGVCNNIVFDNVLARYGVPDKTNCAIITFPNNWQPDASGLVVDSNHQVTFAIEGVNNPSQIGFDHLGVPTQNCAGGCVINIISSEETIQISIESQGYIHAI